MGELIPIVAIIASACVLIALLHYTNERRAVKEGSTDKAELTRENEALRLTVSRLEERLAVLELWQVRGVPHRAALSGGQGDLPNATDPAERTAREIENLR